MLERELKLAVGDTFDPSELPGRLGDWEIRSGGATSLEAVYHDTADLRLLRSGMTLRFREGWTVKLTIPSDQPELMQRMEVAVAGAAGSVPEGALDLVRPAARTNRLLPIARISTARRMYVVSDGRGFNLAEIAFDLVTAEALDGSHTEFRELEVELAEGATLSALDPITSRLRELGAEGVVGVPKLALALGLETVPPAVVPVPQPGSEATIGEVVHGAIAKSVRSFLDSAPAVVVDDDPEGVHQARVATRRLRLHLRTFRRFLDRTRADELRTDLRVITGLLGAVRDLDVLTIRLALLMEDVPEPERSAAKAILATLSVERHEALQRVVDKFREASFVELLDRMVEAACLPQLTDPAGAAATLAFPKLVRKPWRRLCAAVDALSPRPSADELHRIRILAKRTRYAAEAVIPVGGPGAEAFAFRLTELQDVLGEHQDAVFAGAWLRLRDPSQASAADEFLGFEVARANRAAEGWREVWSSIDRPPVTEWMNQEDPSRRPFGTRDPRLGTRD